MPKSNFCKDTKREKRINSTKEFMEGNIAKTGLSSQEISRRTGINISTLNLRRRNPETIRLEELWALVDVLKPDEYYLKKIIGGETK